MVDLHHYVNFCQKFLQLVIFHWVLFYAFCGTKLLRNQWLHFPHCSKSSLTNATQYSFIIFRIVFIFHLNKWWLAEFKTSYSSNVTNIINCLLIISYMCKDPFFLRILFSNFLYILRKLLIMNLYRRKVGKYWFLFDLATSKALRKGIFFIRFLEMHFVKYIGRILFIKTDRRKRNEISKWLKKYKPLFKAFSSYKRY